MSGKLTGTTEAQKAQELEVPSYSRGRGEDEVKNRKTG